MLHAWLGGHVLPTFAGRILNIDVAVERCAATLNVPGVWPDGSDPQRGRLPAERRYAVQPVGGFHGSIGIGFGYIGSATQYSEIVLVTLPTKLCQGTTP